MPNFVKVVNRATKKVLDVPNSSLVEGAGIIQYGDNGGQNQQWELVKARDNYVKIVSRASKKVLDVPNSNPADGVKIIQYTDNGGENQQWELVKVKDNYVKIVNRATKKYWTCRTVIRPTVLRSFNTPTTADKTSNGN